MRWTKSNKLKFIMMNKLNNYSIHGQKQASHDKKNVTSSCITIAWKWHLKHCWIVELLTYPSWWQALLLLVRQQNNRCCCENPIKEEVMSSFYSWDSISICLGPISLRRSSKAVVRPRHLSLDSRPLRAPKYASPLLGSTISWSVCFFCEFARFICDSK